MKDFIYGLLAPTALVLTVLMVSRCGNGTMQIPEHQRGLYRDAAEADAAWERTYAGADLTQAVVYEPVDGEDGQ